MLMWFQLFSLLNYWIRRKSTRNTHAYCPGKYLEASLLKKNFPVTLLQASLPPAKISLPRRVKIVQLSAGLHHTLMLSSDGEVFGFGSNSHGQLGQVRTSLEFYSVSLTGIPDCVLKTYVRITRHYCIILSVFYYNWKFPLIFNFI